jgi:hypothetical protein
LILDKTQSQLAHMERLQRTQSAIGETWEAQYRTAQSEMEGIRDENAALKSRIRRQKKQIELLTRKRILILNSDFSELKFLFFGTEILIFRN